MSATWTWQHQQPDLSWKEEVKEILYHAFLDYLQKQLATLHCPWCPLWHTGLTLQWDGMHLVYALLGSWWRYNLPGQLTPEASWDGDTEVPPELTHQFWLWWCPTPLLAPCLDMCDLWVWALYPKAKCGPVCILLSHWGGLMYCGRGLAGP